MSETNIQNSFNITEVGYASIKNNLINFLKTKPEFTDYDFTASNLNVLISALAYNVEYMAFFMNMVANESFHDSAVLRSNIVSHAKTLGYIPRSITSSKAYLDITFNVTGTPDSIFIPKNTIFTSKIDNKTFSFLTTDAHTITPVLGVYSIEDLELIEGKSFTNTYVINNDNINNKFIISDINVDSSTVVVRVQDSVANLNINTYERAENLLNVSSDSLIYFIQENVDGKFEIFFGDDVFGKKLLSGNVLYIDYIVSSGAASNKASVFSLSSTISSVASVASLTVASRASGGKSRESEEEVRNNSIRSFEAQNRTVTSNDYELYLKKNFTFIESASIWRGDDNIPPVYGKVFISIKPFDDYYLTNTNKENIKNTLKETNVVTVLPEIVDPEYLYLDIKTNVCFDIGKTVRTPNELAEIVRTAIHNYEDLNLKQFNKDFLYSKFSTNIDSIDRSFNSNTSTINVYKIFTPRFTIKNNYSLNFLNSISKGSVSSSDIFLNGRVYNLTDDYNGVLYLKLKGNQLINPLSDIKIGTVDYVNSLVNINEFLPEKNSGAEYTIKISVKTENNDVRTSRNNIIVIDRSVLSITVAQC